MEAMLMRRDGRGDGELVTLGEAVTPVIKNQPLLTGLAVPMLSSGVAVACSTMVVHLEVVSACRIPLLPYAGNWFDMTGKFIRLQFPSCSCTSIHT